MTSLVCFWLMRKIFWPKKRMEQGPGAIGIMIFFSFAAFNLPYCHTPESYRHTEQVAEKLFFFGQWNPNQCKCRQQCLKMLYTSSLESTTLTIPLKSSS